MERPRIDLGGEWGFVADVGDRTIREAGKPLGRISVPGAWQAQGYGSPGGALDMGSHQIDAAYLKHNLVARCLYARSLHIPNEWRGRQVWLVVRRAYMYTDVEMNGQKIGEYEGFSTPFEMNITHAVRFGEVNQLVLGIDNRARPDRNLRGTANYAGNWGGIGGQMWLESRPEVWVDDVFAIPDIDKGEVVLRTTVKAIGRQLPQAVELLAEVRPWAAGGKPEPVVGRASITLSPGSDVDCSEVTVDIPVRLKLFKCWSPEEPALYVAGVSLATVDAPTDAAAVRFGMRKIEQRDNRLLLNGKPIYLTGYGDDATEPFTGTSPSDIEVWRKRLTTMRELGFNYVRHHSMVPHDEYFHAADEVGMLVQPEAPVAYTVYMRLGGGLFEKEWPRIIRAFRNHPCILNWCMGNEFDNHHIQPYMDTIRRAYHLAKAMDPTRPVHTTDGGTVSDPSDVADPRCRSTDSKKPARLHEYGGYCCSLPDFSLIDRLKDAVVQPVTYRRAKTYIEEQGLSEVYPSIYDGSLYMLRDAHKHFMERARLGLDSGYGGGENTGYSYWLGVDYWDSPEGCWDEGILNQLWEAKPHINDTLRQYNAPTVILIDIETGERTFYADESKTIRLMVSHYGREPLESAELKWRITEGGRMILDGAIGNVTCALGERKDIGEITIPAPGGSAPRAFILDVSLEEGSEPVNTNSWTFCSYPRLQPEGDIPGVYSEVGPLPGARVIETGSLVPDDVRLLITDRISARRHSDLLLRKDAAIIVVRSQQFHGRGENPWTDTYFLNSFGGAFGGIIRDHPILREIPHGGRIDPVMYGLVTHSLLYPLDKLPEAFTDGTAVLGLDLTAWVSVTKDMTRVTLLSDVVATNGAHVLLSGLDILEDCPESRFALSRAIGYMLSGKPVPGAGRLAGDWADLFSPSTIYLSFDGDDGKGSSLHPDCKAYGLVRFDRGRCIIGGAGEDARIEIPNPVREGENWSVEYTIQDFDRLVRTTGAGKLVFGLQYSNHRTSTFWRPGSIWANSPAYPEAFAVGYAPSVWADALTEPTWAVPVPQPAPNRVTIKVVTDVEAGECNCYVAYGEDATTPTRRATNLKLAARMPLQDLAWNQAPGFVHIATTGSVAPVEIDDVIIEGSFGRSFGSAPPSAQ